MEPTSTAIRALTRTPILITNSSSIAHDRRPQEPLRLTVNLFLNTEWLRQIHTNRVGWNLWDRSEPIQPEHKRRSGENMDI
jgi:hypothetical protein